MKNIVLFTSSIILLLFTINLGCQYVSPFSEGKDLIANLDLSADWIRDDGLILETTSDTPPTGETQAYFLHFLNLVSYDTFETSTATSDTGTWQNSLAPSPSISETKTGTDLYGNKHLHLSLKRDFGAETFFHNFSMQSGKNYIFKFYFIHQSGGNLQLSLGETGDDLQYREISYTSTGVEEYAQWDFYSSTNSSNMQIRFGYAEALTPGSINYEIYVDNIALLLQSNHNISKPLNIVGSDIVDPTDDGTGEKFYEGIYQLRIFAKQGSSSVITLRIGNNYKTYDLTANWVEYILEDQISKEYGYLNIEIMPTKTNEKESFPGGIYITPPHLFFLPNQSTPKEYN